MSSVILHLDNYQFYSGNLIRGKGICHFTSSKEVRQVRLRLIGKEHTHWIGSESYYDSIEEQYRDRSVTYKGNRDFFLRDHIVHGEGTMGIGEHVFPFEFAVPEDLPSTFNHNYGNIKFSIKLTVDRPWRPDYETEREVTIISPIRLQMISPTFKQPIDLSDEKTICCLCCASGPIHLDVSLEKRAFVVGESVEITVYCLNMSNVNVESIVAKIKQNLRFKTTCPSTDYKYDTELVTISHNSGVAPHQEKTFNIKMEIPPSTIVPNFTGCELLSCNTELKVCAAISGAHTNLNTITEIVIGHVCYNQGFQSSAQFQQSIPPYPVNNIVPVHVPVPMPMPMANYNAGKAAEGVSSDPIPAYCPGPSTPQEIGAPCASSKLNLGEDTAYSAPPTYDESFK